MSKASEYRLDAEWVAPIVAQSLWMLPPGSIAKVFADRALSDAKYVRSCLSRCRLTHQMEAQLLDRAFTTGRGWWYAVDQPPFNAADLYVDLSNHATQTFSTLHLLELLTKYGLYSQRFLVRYVSLGSVDLYRGDNVHDDTHMPEALLTEWQKMVESLDHVRGSVPDGVSVLPHFDLCYWLVKCIVDVSGAASQQEFRIFVSDVLNHHPTLAHFLNTHGQLFSPLLPLLVNALESGEVDRFEEVRSLLPRLSSPRDLETLRTQVVEYLQHIKGSSAMRFVSKFLLLGPSLSVHEITDEESATFVQQTGVPLEYALELGLSYHGIDPELIDLGPDEFVTILDGMIASMDSNRRIEEHAQQFANLTLLSWSSNEEVVRKCHQLLVLVVDRMESYPAVLGPMACRLVTRVLEAKSVHDDDVASALRTIGQYYEWQETSLFYEVPPSASVAKVLGALQPYLSDSEQALAKGAATVMNGLLNSVLRYLPSRLEQKREDYYSPIDLPSILDLLDREESWVREAAIRLLAISTVPIEDFGQRFVDRMIASSYQSEVQAWSAFVEYAQAEKQSTANDSWLTFLETALDRRPNIDPVLRESLTSKYRDLVTSRTGKMVFDDNELGLPFSLGKCRDS